MRCSILSSDDLIITTETSLHLYIPINTEKNLHVYITIGTEPSLHVYITIGTDKLTCIHHYRN